MSVRVDCSWPQGSGPRPAGGGRHRVRGHRQAATQPAPRVQPKPDVACMLVHLLQPDGHGVCCAVIEANPNPPPRAAQALGGPVGVPSAACGSVHLPAVGCVEVHLLVERCGHRTALGWHDPDGSCRRYTTCPCALASEKRSGTVLPALKTLVAEPTWWAVSFTGCAKPFQAYTFQAFQLLPGPARLITGQVKCGRCCP